MKYQKEVSVAKEIALEAGKIILKYFDADQEVLIKEDQSPVTKADILINEYVIEQLEKSFPEDGVIGEEKSNTEYGLGRKWFCDPIDGTNGYVWGTPTAMFSLALVEDGRPVLGVVYDAFLSRLYVGVKGEGVWCNDVELRVSDRVLKGGYVSITANVTKILSLKYLPALLASGAHIPVFSGAVYRSCLIVRGKIDAYIESCVGAHDMAAVQVFVEEAGGKITNFKGEDLDYSKPFEGAIVSNGKVHKELVEIVGC